MRRPMRALAATISLDLHWRGGRTADEEEDAGLWIVDSMLKDELEKVPKVDE